MESLDRRSKVYYNSVEFIQNYLLGDIYIMEQKKIDRINELAKKKQAGTLTEEEAAERAVLHQEYINDIRRSFGAILDNTVIEYPDGSRKSLKK